MAKSMVSELPCIYDSWRLDNGETTEEEITCPECGAELNCDEYNYRGETHGKCLNCLDNYEMGHLIKVVEWEILNLKDSQAAKSINEQISEVLKCR